MNEMSKKDKPMNEMSKEDKAMYEISKKDKPMHEMTKINVDIPHIKWTLPSVEFDTFETYKKLAYEIAEVIHNFPLSEETVKTAKKMLATSRKLTSALDKKRLEIKKSILEPYVAFENQINELKSIVDEADLFVRDQVKELEEMEKEAKKEAILEIWNKRIQQYEAGIIPNLFERWLTPQHLNKSMSIKKVEEDMTNYLEAKQRDLEALNTMDSKSELIAEYFKTLSLAETLANHREQVEREELAKKATKILDADDEEEEMEIFIISGKRNIAMARLLLDTNGIKYALSKGL